MNSRVFRKMYSFGLAPFKFFVKTLLDLIYPPYCLICQQRLQDHEEAVCATCWLQLPRLAQHSQSLRHPLFNEIHFEQFLSVWQFEESFQQIIHLLKYQNFSKLARQMGSFMAEACLAQPEYKQADLLLPVPLHISRKRERGYNQSALLCRQIAEQTGIPVSTKVLKRVQNTKTQTRLNAEKRARNVKSAFKVTKPDLVNGKSIILVDDVVTTGATLNACAGELQLAGAKKVLLLTAAKA